MTDHRKHGTATRRALVVGAHLLVGVLTVGSQALIPAGLVPPVLEAWLRILVAVLLAAGASFLTTVTSNGRPASRSAGDGQSLTSPSRAFWRRPKFWGLLLSFAMVAVASGYLYRPTLPTSLAEPQRVGNGLDIAGYCASYGFDGKVKETCYLSVPVTEICNWEHKRKDLTLVYTDPEDLESGICVDAKGTSIKKGIENMQGFCREKFKNRPDIRYRKRDEAKEWRCEAGINKNVVCVWQYGQEGLVARKDEEGDTWQCYRPRKQ